MQELQSIGGNFPPVCPDAGSMRNKIAQNGAAALKAVATDLASGDLSGVSRSLDEIDLRILSELQADGRITMSNWRGRVGISPPRHACAGSARWSRKAISWVTAAIGPAPARYDVTVFASVPSVEPARRDLRAFEDFVSRAPLVRECWMLSGEVDFILKCVAPDMATFQAFVTQFDRRPASPQRPHLAGVAERQIRRRGAAGIKDIAELIPSAGTGMPARRHRGMALPAENVTH